MIRQRVLEVSLPNEYSNILSGIKPWNGVYWSKPKKCHDRLKEIIDNLRDNYRQSQLECSYCGLKLGGTSNGELDHIAPKSSHPEFTFVLENITVACHLCNSTSKKGRFDTISDKKSVYDQCEFCIIHPYFDNPSDHIEFLNKDNSVIIQVKNNSTKGRNTISHFNLNEPRMTFLRTQEMLFERLREKYKLEEEIEDLISEVLNP